MDDKTQIMYLREKVDFLDKQDCLSCKLFGSTACLAMAGYTAYWSLRQCTQYRGVTRLAYLTSCFGLASGLAYLGVKRAFQ